MIYVDFMNTVDFSKMLLDLVDLIKSFGNSGFHEIHRISLKSTGFHYGFHCGFHTGQICNEIHNEISK